MRVYLAWTKLRERSAFVRYMLVKVHCAAPKIHVKHSFCSENPHFVCAQVQARGAGAGDVDKGAVLPYGY